VALGAALIAVAVVLLTSNNDPGPQTQAETTATPGPTPTVVSMKRVATAAAGNRPTSIALMPRRVWVGERKRPVLRAFEPATLRPLRTAAIPTGVSQLVPSSHGLWATMWRAKAVARLDPRTGRIVGRPISLPGTPSTLAVTGDSLYVGLVAEVTGGFATILKLDRATGAIVWSKQLKRQADRLVWLNGSLWAMVSTPNRLFRIDPDGVIREGFDLPGSDADDLKAAGGWLWATVREPDSLVRIDPRTGQRANTFVGRSPSGLSVQGDDVWVALWYPSRLALVNARTLRKRTRDVDVGLNPFMVASDSTGAWVVCAGGGQVVRVSKR
jgi:streptogramin lyase